MSKNLYVDFHVLQTVPPSCVNRDDTGSPKTAVYGGVRRARVSSQSWKHAMRESFKQYFKEEELGFRTKNIVDMVAKEILSVDGTITEKDAVVRAVKILNKAGVTTTPEGQAKALFFLGAKQAKNLAELALKEEEPDKKAAKAALQKEVAIEVALFGRMVADDPVLNEEASSQVAHSISTHKVENEYDFYTAVDDLSKEEHAGAGMMGTMEYNSSTLYRYATVAVHNLKKQLANQDEVLEKAIGEFARAFITSMPTGKVNTFANHTLPYSVLVTLREDQPISLVGAFEEPVKAGDEGYEKKSAKRLENYAQNVYSDFASAPIKSYVIGEHLIGLNAEKLSVSKLVASIGKEVSAYLSEGISR